MIVQSEGRHREVFSIILSVLQVSVITPPLGLPCRKLSPEERLAQLKSRTDLFLSGQNGSTLGHFEQIISS
jgi:hypothetical protein